MQGLGLRSLLVAGLAWAVAAPSAVAEPAKIGIVKTSASGHVFIAVDKGYFADEGIEAELIPFDAAQPVTIAVVTGDLDIGVSALNAAFYNLAGQGALRLIAGQSRDVATYQNISYLVSNHAWDAGFTSLRDFPGHAVALTQIGAPAHYALGLLAEKYDFDLKSLRLVPLSSFPNIVSALAGNQVDAALLAATPGLTAVDKGEAKLLGWVGDETPWQIGGVFVSTSTADGRPEFLERFLRAYVRGARDYYAAFSGPDGKRRDGPTAPAVLATIAKYVGLPSATLRFGIGYVDPDARLDMADIEHQIAWYRSQNMLKGSFTAADVTDRRYAKPLRR